MKLYTNDNNTATLKVIIASTISGKQVEIIKTNFDDPVFNGPRQLPLLEVNEDLLLFSSNAATLYFFPDGEESNKGQSQQLQEWEATRLSPSVAAVLSSKSPPGDLRQALKSQLQVIDGLLTTSPYVLGSTLSAVDVIFFSTIYPLHNNEDLRKTYLDELKHLSRWYLQLAASKHVQSAVQQWGGCPTGPFAATSALGIPQNTNLGSPAGTPDESKVEGPSAEELSLARESWLHGHKNLPKPTPKPDVILPVKGRKNRLITSALPYVNNEPHLGNIIGCVLSADIFARYCRLCDYNTLFVCGTDEYGTATENKAVEEGLSPREICDKYHAVHAAAYRWFDAHFDYFGRTSTPQQTEISQKLFLKLHDNGFISSHTVEQLFCEQCERFLADRFVEGTCPHPGCNYDSARGDQCDLCGRLVVATELKDPKCKQCGNKPVLRDSTQLFLDLPLLEPSLRSWITSSWDGWSAAARGAARGWLREALHSRAITRDLRWGVPVPLQEYASKVFYVWFDAPIGYLSITQCATGDYEKWWKPEKGVDVSLYQFMAKDNVPFHALLFPAALIGANEGHLLVKHIYATEYLNYEEGKFSKSRGVGVFATDAKVSGIPADVWRFYLAAARPEAADCSFSWRELLTRNNSELLNNLGNFCHRALSFCATAFKGKVPAAVMEATDYEFIALVNREYAAYVDNMEKGKLRESLRHVLSIGRLGNQLMQATQPWALLKGSDEDRTRAETCVSLCVNVACLLSLLLAPYTPEAAKRLKEQLNAPDLLLQPDTPTLMQLIPAGHALGTPTPLFSRLDPAAIDRLRDKYAGSQADRAAKKSAPSIKDLELAIAVQADKVRQMKATTKDKAAWQPLVDVLLDLKKQLVEAQTKPKAGTVSVGELEKAVAEQADKVRQIKASTKDKAVIQPAVDKLLELKKQLAAAQSSQPTSNVGNGLNAAELEKAVAEQADKVRQIKASTKDKAVIQPAVDKLLALKKQLAAAQSNQPTTGNTTALSVAELEKAVAEQGDKVRQIKASTKDKAVIQPAVDKLLELKKQLSAAQSSQPTTGNTTGLSVAELEKAVAEQGDKVRQIKASTKDKAVIQPAVDKLLELKKQLATAQSNQLSSGNDVKLSVAELEKAVAAQGDIVRQLKASTKDKAAWQPALAVLQDLKKKLAAAQ